MDNQRLFLFIALSFVTLLLWQAWTDDYGPQPQPQSQAPAPAEVAEQTNIADLPGDAGPDLPEASGITPAPGSETGLLKSAASIDVETDMFHVSIDTFGGDIRVADLREYRTTIETGAPPFRLLNDTLPNIFIVQSGLRSSTGTEPTHHIEYRAEQDSYRMAADADTLVVPLVWQGPDGVEVIKRYTFTRGSHTVLLEHVVKNNSGSDWNGRQYRQLQRTQVAETGQSTFIYTYMGGVIYSPEEKYEKIKFEKMLDEDLDRTVTDGWVAMLQHYFLGALIPNAGETERFYTKTLDHARYVIGMISQGKTIPAGTSDTFSTRVFIGPKLQHEMHDVATGLDLTVDYGKLTFLAQPVFWLLEKIHSVVGNWGWAIILVTLSIKLVFYKLSETSYRSMANMRKLTPRLQSLKERYKDDRQKLNQAMMDLYKKEKINPLGGCLPILVQIPVFISLYWVLLESVEMRHAPFMLWIQDLSSPDPYYVLPLLMGVSMFIQQKLNPAPLDPIQAKVMMALPFVFTVFFAFFPSGLVLYWVVNNVLSIAQQWVITRRIEAGGK